MGDSNGPASLRRSANAPGKRLDAIVAEGCQLNVAKSLNSVGAAYWAAKRVFVYRNREAIGASVRDDDCAKSNV